ncbi:hypothetical protein ACFO3A_06765 [Comamonas nitrativorans]|uniref:Uncharacterized protein n=1 Tax=Comamonas nitrativorans TaxID=108437 RepID=A0ABV9GXV4_9BURK
MIPDEVLNEIVARAKSQWPDDNEMQAYCISAEKEGYARLQNIDFGDLASLRDEFIESARDSFEAWDEIYDSVASEFSAYRKIIAFSADGLSWDVVEKWKTEAKKDNEGYYAGQFDFLEKKLRKHASILATRQQIDGIKNLLIELENIIGSECYNGSIQNYGSWGELESEGRHFRYPVKFYNGSNESKKWTISPSIPSEELITGYYAFGANQLNIYRALFKIILHLRKNYDLKV